MNEKNKQRPFAIDRGKRKARRSELRHIKRTHTLKPPNEQRLEITKTDNTRKIKPIY